MGTCKLFKYTGVAAARAQTEKMNKKGETEANKSLVNYTVSCQSKYFRQMNRYVYGTIEQKEIDRSGADLVAAAVSVEDLEDPEVEAFELLENQRGGADKECSVVGGAGIVQDHYPEGQSLMQAERRSTQRLQQGKER
jgi:hypothetical protein